MLIAQPSLLRHYFKDESYTKNGKVSSVVGTCEQNQNCHNQSSLLLYPDVSLFLKATGRGEATFQEVAVGWRWGTAASNISIYIQFQYLGYSVNGGKVGRKGQGLQVRNVPLASLNSLHSTSSDSITTILHLILFSNALFVQNCMRQGLCCSFNEASFLKVTN